MLGSQHDFGTLLPTGSRIPTTFLVPAKFLMLPQAFVEFRKFGLYTRQSSMPSTPQHMNYKKLHQHYSRILTYFIRRCITVRLTSCFSCFFNGPIPVSFRLFSVFSSKQFNFCSKSIWKNVMSIQYLVPGFEPMASWTWAVSYNHKTRAPVEIDVTSPRFEPTISWSWVVSHNH